MKTLSYLFLVLVLLAPAGSAFAGTCSSTVDGDGTTPSPANAISCVTNTCYPHNSNPQGATPPINSIEPNLQTNVQTSQVQTAGGVLSSSTWIKENSSTDVTEPGVTIINGVFTVINGVMNSIEATFYTGVVNDPNFHNAISGLLILYLTIYGIMIWFNLASYRTGEIIDRLFKVALVWGVTSSGGFDFFSQYIGYPVINLMNGIIVEFMVAAAPDINLSTTPTTAVDFYHSVLLDPAAMVTLVASMDLVFSITFLAMILAHLSLPFGWIFVLIILWSMLEFILMLVGAFVTYVKGVVGLMFLFALAPIFFSFILFGQSRRVFVGWVNQAFGFFLHPVLLFAFLAFYMVLMRAAISNLLFTGADGQPINYCWVTWLHFWLFDIDWWRPINSSNPQGGQGPDWVTANIGGTWWGESPVSLLQILFFLLLAHIGKNLCKFIEHIARDLSGGHGPGIVRDNDVAKWFSNYMPGMQGRSIAELGVELGGRGLAALKSAKGGEGSSMSDSEMVSKRGSPTTYQESSSNNNSGGTGQSPGKTPGTKPGTPKPGGTPGSSIG